jgi:hypothetical protein
MSENRIGQWFVDARDSQYIRGPITYQAGQVWMADYRYIGISESSIAAGYWLRIPPRPDLPPGLATRECRLPKKGERYGGLTGGIETASCDWRDWQGDDYAGRRWIVADEPEAEKPHGPTCVELTTAFRDIQRLLTEYLVPDGCNAHETITKILAITDTKPFSQLRRETHDETRI